MREKTKEGAIQNRAGKKIEKAVAELCTPKQIKTKKKVCSWASFSKKARSKLSPEIESEFLIRVFFFHGSIVLCFSSCLGVSFGGFILFGFFPSLRKRKIVDGR